MPVSTFAHPIKNSKLFYSLEIPMMPSYEKLEFLMKKLISIFDRVRYVPNTGASTLKVIQNSDVVKSAANQIGVSCQKT